jgi:hypothetical protein
MVTPVTTSQLRPAMRASDLAYDSRQPEAHPAADEPTCSCLDRGFSKISDVSPWASPPSAVSFSGGKMTTVSAVADQRHQPT